MIGKTAGESAPSPLGAAPPIPGMARPGALAPPVPGNGNRARSNSDQSGRDSSVGTSIDTPLQLGGLFAGGIPKLKKRGGGVDTGGR